MPTPIAIAVVEHEGRFLIGQRPEGVALAGLWEFPGGRVLPDETPESAAVRECREETGLAVEPLFRYPEHVHQYDHDRVELFFIACRVVPSGSTSPREPFQWVAREGLPKYDFPDGNRELLRVLLTAAADSQWS
ncbi:MAG: (deoxy)nucleoside triphosphate pyrophosphohydrolase [Planctomycetaceae bacterium]|nr:(deoxy)nucleoside triphosphate pyrophosphohydrolase [Planctomycetaceae bacterium]